MLRKLSLIAAMAAALRSRQPRSPMVMVAVMVVVMVAVMVAVIGRSRRRSLGRSRRRPLGRSRRRPLGGHGHWQSRRLGGYGRWRLWCGAMAAAVAAVVVERTVGLRPPPKKPALARASMCLRCTLQVCEIDAGDEFRRCRWKLVRRVGFLAQRGAIVIDPRFGVVE